MDALTAYDWPGNVRELRNIVERLVIRGRSRELALTDLPADVKRVQAPAAAEPLPQDVSRAEALYDEVVFQGTSFWDVVYEPFMQRDLTRDDIRALIAKGLHETRGSYTHLIKLFHLERADYKRFLNFLHKHGCHMPVKRFKTEFRRPSRGPADLPGRSAKTA